MTNITHQEGGQRGFFYYMKDGVRMGELTYNRAGDLLVVIDHTEVDPSLRGKGVARELLDAAVAWARETHTKIIPSCSYAVVQFSRDASIRDVLAEQSA